MQPKLYTLYWILSQEAEAEQGNVNKPEQDRAAQSKLEPPQHSQQWNPLPAPLLAFSK